MFKPVHAMSGALPRLAVSCVVRRGGAVLLVQRGKAPARGRWAFPGGSVEAFETMSSAVIREVLEETGLTVAEPRFVTHHEIVDRAAGVHFVIVVHEARCDGASEPVAGDDAADARFVAASELAALDVTETTLDTLDMLGIADRR